MKYLTLKNVKSLLLFITCIVLSSCIDSCTENKASRDTNIEQKVDSTVIATAQLTEAKLGYYIKE